MARTDNYSQGIYEVKNPEKYVGKKKPFYRSSYEKRLFYYMDNNELVLEWSSESICIPYLFDVDNTNHRYYPDIIAKIKTNSGIVTYVIEIKPFKQTQPPLKPKNNNQKRLTRYNNELFMYIKNTNKWKYAEEYCKKYNYVFKIITENDIFV